MKFYNHKEIKIKDRDEFKTKVFELNVPSLYGMKYFEELDAAIQSFVNRIEKNQPTLIEIVGDFSLLKEANEEDKDDFVQTIVSFFVDAFIDRENRTEKKEAMIRTNILRDANLLEMKKIQVRSFQTILNE